MNYSQPTVTIALAQINLLVGAIEDNTHRIIQAIEQCKKLAVDVVVFPELTLTAYPPEDLLLRPKLQQQVNACLQQLMQASENIIVIVGHPQLKGGHLYNATSILQNGSVLACYQKQQLPNYGVFDEKRYFTAGDQACVFEVKGIVMGVSICEDIWSPEVAAQTHALGAQILLNLNASPFHIGKQNERLAILKQRSTENNMPILYVNLVGGQDELVFDGGTCAVQANGELLCQAPFFEENISIIHCLSQAESIVLSTPDNALLNPSLSKEALVYKALVLGVRDYIQKNGFKGVVLGLSGGIDSALVLAIAVDAIGKSAVEAVMMPSQYTAEMSLQDAQAEAELLGVAYQVLPINETFAAFLKTLEHEFAGLPVDAAEENIQARCRGILLMAISNKKNKILLTTGNKSEMAVGYATLYGDMAGGFAPIKDVPKMLVYQLAVYRNQIAPVIPQRVIERPPSAELAPAQKDEDTLPPYDILDVILEKSIELDQDIEEIVQAGFDEETVKRVVAMVRRNEYKRRQAPPGVRITKRAFGRDRRYPITSGYKE